MEPKSARSLARRAAALAPWLLLLIACGALFSRLGQRALWEDEAETALLAGSVLSHGLPYAGTGKNVISQELQHEIGWNDLWTWTPWLQIYPPAASFYLFGTSAWAARFPFALLGLLGLWFFYHASLRVFSGDRRRSGLALFFLATSVPLLLQFRQCRGYSLAFLEFLLWWHGYWGLLEHKPKSAGQMILGMVGLFYTQQLTFTMIAGAFLIGHLLFFRSRTPRFVSATLCAAMLCLPWLVLQHHFSPVRSYDASFLDKFRYYAAELNAHHLPILLVAPWLGLKVVRARDFGIEKTIGDERPLAFACLFVASYLLFVCTGSYPFHYRYLVPIIPAIGWLEAAACWDILSRLRRPWLAYALPVLLSATNALNMAVVVDTQNGDNPRHFEFHCWWSEFLHELTEPYRGPISALSRYLNAAAAKSDVVWITYGDLPLRFHTPLQVYGGLSGVQFSSLPSPRWVILRSATIGGKTGWDLLMKNYVQSRWDLDRDFERIELDAPDAPWENRPDPDQHYFITPQSFPRVALYRRR